MFYNHNPSPSLAHKLSHGDGLGMNGHRDGSGNGNTNGAGGGVGVGIGLGSNGRDLNVNTNGGGSGGGGGNGSGNGGAVGPGWRHPSSFNPSLSGMPPPPQSPGFNLSLGGLGNHAQGGGGGSGGGAGFGGHLGGNSGVGGGGGPIGHGGNGSHGYGGGHAPHGSLSFGQGQSQAQNQSGSSNNNGMHNPSNNNPNPNSNSNALSALNQSQNGGNPSLGGLTHFNNLGGLGVGAQNSPPPGRAGQGGGLDGGVVGYWQQQMVKAEACRQSSSPHHRARASALASRMVNQKTAVPILDPNRPSSAASNIHRKITSVSIRDDDSSDGLVSALGHPSALTNTGGTTAETTKSEPWTGIDLGGIRLRTLTPSLFGFTHITTLYINHNSLTYLSPAISNLRQLTHLDVTGNQLQAVPPELGLLSSLKELLLFDNNIQDLPLELGTLFQLDFLGIEGNPINENLRAAMSEKGTQGLIRYFRDNCPMPLPPAPRKWEVLEEEVGGGAGEGREEEDFSIFSYNVLCERAATPQMYGYTPSWALDWSYRRDTIMQQITDAMTDIICLQEVDDTQYHELFLPRMTELGYEGAFNLKTRARTMTTDEKRFVDGCATFWKASKYQLVERRVIEFNQVALQKADMRTEDMFNRVMSKDNIALVCVFENIQTETRLVVSNAHHHWDAGDRDVKLVQVAMLVEETEKIASHFARLPPKYISGQESRLAPRYSDSSTVPLIICGDFNSMPDSAVYEYLSGGSVPADHEDFMGYEYGGYTARGLSHRLSLKSAYSGLGELFMTNYTPGFVGPIDYVWYSHPTMTVTSVLGEVDKAYLARTVGFPNCHFPSDHIPIAANFTLKPAATSPANAKRSYY